jgi:hypothetical protein
VQVQGTRCCSPIGQLPVNPSSVTGVSRDSLNWPIVLRLLQGSSTRTSKVLLMGEDSHIRRASMLASYTAGIHMQDGGQNCTAAVVAAVRYKQDAPDGFVMGEWHMGGVSHLQTSYKAIGTPNQQTGS